MTFDDGSVLTVRVKGVPFPIAFGDWGRRTLMERLENMARDFAQQVLDVVREEILRAISPPTAHEETAVPTSVMPKLRVKPHKVGKIIKEPRLGTPKHLRRRDPNGVLSRVEKQRKKWREAKAKRRAKLAKK